MSFTEAWLEGPSSTSFYTRTYKTESPKAVLVFVHGFAEHIGRYGHIHPRFAEAGITVFAFDQRGFGKTALDNEHKSKNSKYGQTSWPDQFLDIEWAIKHAKETYAANLPIFIMGHSMGGGLSLAFQTREHAPPARSTVSLLAGVIATSPLVLQAKPASKLTRWVGGKVSHLTPYILVPTDVKPETLSHDPAVGEAYIHDPLVKSSGSLRNVSDMLDGGEQLLAHNYKFWPEDLPVLFIHGSADQVSSHVATQKFYELIKAKDKTLSIYPDGYHELQNEPNGVQDKLVAECVAFILARLGKVNEGSSKL